MMDTSGISSSLVREIWMLLEVRRKTKRLFLVARVILGFLSFFNRSHASSTFEALNCTGLSRCQRGVRTTVQMRRGPTAFSRVPTEDSNIPSCSEMKNEPAIKPLLGNPVFFRVRACWCPFHLRQQIQYPLPYLLLKEASS